jgi:hypothetical protein
MNGRDNKPVTALDLQRVQQQVAGQRMAAASAAATQEAVSAGLTVAVAVLGNEVLPPDAPSLTERVTTLEDAGAASGLTHMQVMLRGLGC